MSEVNKYQKQGSQLHKVINRALLDKIDLESGQDTFGRQVTLDKEWLIIDSRRHIYAL